MFFYVKCMRDNYWELSGYSSQKHIYNIYLYTTYITGKTLVHCGPDL